jgi:hypothetical protein
MDADPAVNPDFAFFNRVVLYYCDGASFSGDKDEPYVYPKTNQTLYFRGARVLDALLDALIQDHGLNKATDVLLSGGSAGGLSTYLHADYVGGYLKVRCVHCFLCAFCVCFVCLYGCSVRVSL